MKTTVWKFLMEYKVKTLPMDPIRFARAIGCVVYDYNEGAEILERLQLEEAAKGREGLSARCGGRSCILYAPGLVRRRRNHVILHELGHCVEGHDNGAGIYGDARDAGTRMQQEAEAEEYALEAVPTPVLYKAGLTTAKDIQRVTQLDDDAVGKILSRVTQYAYVSFGVEEEEICSYFRDYIRAHKRQQKRQGKYRRQVGAVVVALALMLLSSGVTAALLHMGKGEPAAAPAVTAPGALSPDQTVYWTENGDVYHLDRDCQHIRNRTNVESGTVEESGKDRLCKTCG